MFRRRWVALAIVLALLSGAGRARARAQDNVDGLRKELSDTLAQLKAAQDRKNELANENEKLKSQIAVMQKQLDECSRSAANAAEQTYNLRAHRAAWEAFVAADARLKVRWDLFLAVPPVERPAEVHVLSLPMPASLQSAATMPTTRPASMPAPQTIEARTDR